MFKKLFFIGFIASVTACAIAPDADEHKVSNGEASESEPVEDSTEDEAQSTSQAASSSCRWLNLECCNGGRNLRRIWQCKVAGQWTNVGNSKCAQLPCAF